MYIKPLGVFVQTCELTEGFHLFSIPQWLWRMEVGWLCRAAQLSGQLKLPPSRGRSCRWSLLPGSNWGHRRGYKEQRKERMEWKKEGWPEESWKNKEREGWRKEENGRVTLCSTVVLWLVVTKGSIKIAHNLASEVESSKREDRDGSFGTQMTKKGGGKTNKTKRDKTNNETFTYKTERVSTWQIDKC